MNLLDSSGWIEYFAGGPNAERFAAVVEDIANLLVPTIVLHEVYRWVDREGALASARLARQHRLPTADSIVYASAQSRGAIVWTQDEDFRDLQGVRYFPKIKARPSP